MAPAPHLPRIGLVLGAGGTRGCAHAAVIQVLREAGVPIHVVVGASVGAMYGLGLAAGQPTEQIVRSAQNATALELARFYAGRLRVHPGNPVARLLYEAGAGKNFSDLQIPFAVTATEISTGEVHVLDRGPVLPAVEASIAIPFVARPVVIDGHAYVDGGLFSTVPVSVARAMGAEKVIAVCLGINYNAPAWLRRRPDLAHRLHALSRGTPLGRNRWREQLRFGARLLATGCDPPAVEGDADVEIWPEFGKVTSNSLTGARFCYEQGLKAAREALPAIKAWLEVPSGTMERHI